MCNSCKNSVVNPRLVDDSREQSERNFTNLWIRNEDKIRKFMTRYGLIKKKKIEDILQVKSWINWEGKRRLKRTLSRNIVSWSCRSKDAAGRYKYSSWTCWRILKYRDGYRKTGANGANIFKPIPRSALTEVYSFHDETRTEGRESERSSSLMRHEKCKF